MSVSVLLTVLDGGSGIAALFDALPAQSASPNEIAIVDSGSRNTTQAVLQQYATGDQRLKVPIAAGASIAHGWNLAIQRAIGDLLAVIDGRCGPDRDWLRELLRPLRDDHAVGAVAGRFMAVTKGRFGHYFGQLSMPDFTSDAQPSMRFGRSSAFQRSLWQQAGGHPEWPHTAADTQFASRAQCLTDYKIVFVPAAIL